MADVDLLVAGGGPTGLAAAIYAAQAGLSVIIVEPKPGEIDKACGEGLMPRARLTLAEMGITELPGMPFAGIRYISETTSGAARFTLGPGIGVRRTALHSAMRARAKSLGVRWHEARVTDWTEDDTGIQAVGHQARWMIAADGLQSQIRKKLGPSRPSCRPERFGVRQHFNTAPWSEFVDVHWRAQVEAYVTPIGPQTTSVGFLFVPEAVPPGPGAPFDRLLTLFPEIAKRLGAPCSTIAGAGPFAQDPSVRQDGRVLLAGDAAGYVDPLTGEGIRVGIDTAKAAVNCIASGQPERYGRAWSRATWRYRWLTTALLMIRLRPWMQRRIVPTVARLPWLLRRALDFLNGP